MQEGPRLAVQLDGEITTPGRSRSGYRRARVPRSNWMVKFRLRDGVAPDTGGPASRGPAGW